MMTAQENERPQPDTPAPSDVSHLSQKQLARRLGVSQRTLEGWRYRGKGPAYLRLEGRILYRAVDIERFELECLQSGPRTGFDES